MRVGLGEQLARGIRSAVYAWGDDAVAKVPVASTPDAWIHFEARYTAAVHDAGAPAPELLGIEHVAGRAASIYRRVRGRSMWELMLDAPRSIPAHANELADLQAHVLSLVPPVSLPAQRDRLTCKIRQAASRVDSTLAAALGQLPPVGVPSLCHGDLHPGNVIMSADGPVLVDWFDAARGDRIADIARTALLLSARAHGDAGPGHLPGCTPEALAVLRTSYLQAISEHIAVEKDELDRWEALAAVARAAEGIDTARLVEVWRSWYSSRTDLVGA